MNILKIRLEINPNRCHVLMDDSGFIYLYDAAADTLEGEGGMIRAHGAPFVFYDRFTFLAYGGL